MTTASALISLLVAIAVLVASFFQWWGITWGGKMTTRTWVKWLFSACIAALVAAFVFLVVDALK